MTITVVRIEDITDTTSTKMKSVLANGEIILSNTYLIRVFSFQTVPSQPQYEDHSFDGIHVLVYTSSSPEVIKPATIFIHGGGWLFGKPGHKSIYFKYYNNEKQINCRMCKNFYSIA